ncbi:hypothetical protein HJFPF1_04726 [Paramyrothecium foliicola]|nr:hypothetical protein HJFPF1_04726 [Paramyrothecium foliicola]
MQLLVAVVDRTLFGVSGRRVERAYGTISLRRGPAKFCSSKAIIAEDQMFGEYRVGDVEISSARTFTAM